MKQATHAWIAIRAVGLLQEELTTKGLAALLTPHIPHAALGAWMPDLADSKLGSGDLDNHVFKMGPYRGAFEERFVTHKDELLKALGPARAVAAFLAEDRSLDVGWWRTPFKADPLPCQDLPTRTNALSTTLTDQLVMGDAAVSRRIPRKFSLSRELTEKERTRAEQLALYFFMQSHFIADACMPCHCDARPLSGYQGGLHAEWEEMMEQAVPEFERTKIGCKVQGARCREDNLIERAKEVDARFGISFPASIPTPRTSDPWRDNVAVCRASFAVASVIANPRCFPYHSDRGLTLKDLRRDSGEWSRFEKATAAVMHDAVLNVAMGWKRIWGRFTVDGARCTEKKGASA